MISSGRSLILEKFFYKINKSFISYFYLLCSLGVLIIKSWVYTAVSLIKTVPGFNMSSLPALKLYFAWVCPYVQRVSLLLAHLGVKYETIHIDLGNKPSWYTEKINQEGKVPALEMDDGTVITESLVINEFLADIFKEKHDFLGPDAITRARVRGFIVYVDSKIIPTYYQLLRAGEEEVTVLKEKLTQYYEKVDELLRQLSPTGPFTLGNELSLADLALAPWQARLFLLRELKQFDLDPTAPKLQRYHQWAQAIEALPEVASTTWDKASLLKVYGEKYSSSKVAK